MRLIGVLVVVILAILSLRRMLWAYGAFVILGLLYFPARVGFRLRPGGCELALDPALALLSLTNYKHVVLFALFFLMTSAQLRRSGWRRYAWPALATLIMGTLVELAEGVTGGGHCRLRDLVPDAVGAVVGAAMVASWGLARSKASRRAS